MTDVGLNAKETVNNLSRDTKNVIYNRHQNENRKLLLYFIIVSIM